MIINHNITAMAVQNSLNANTQATQSSLQKLSSGLRINSAADDAAGLAISEKMKGQISGLEQASSNSQDGISMLQTAEGGLDQTHSILQRMRQLAVQSSTDTNTDSDRQKIQAEVDQLSKEVTNISNTTQFNTQNLLAGGMSDTFQIGANAGQNMSVSISAMDAQTLGVAGSITTAATVVANGSGLNLSTVSRGITAATGYRAVVTVTAATVSASVTRTVNTNVNNAKTLTLGSVGNLANTTTTFTGTVNTDYQVKIAAVTAVTAGNSAGYNNVSAISYSKDNGVSWTTVTGNFNSGGSVKIDGVSITLATSTGKATSSYSVGDSYSFSVSASKETMQLKDTFGNNIGSSVDAHYGDTTATIGDNLSNKTVSLQFNYNKVTTASLKFVAHQTNSSAASVTQGKVLAQGTVQAGISVATLADASKAITAIDNAINTVSTQRSAMGAYENRLTDTVNNLDTSDQNITSAQSQLTDVDMSKEISTYQKNNVLQQAATAMLAHANQQPQTVLSLLQG